MKEVHRPTLTTAIVILLIVVVVYHFTLGRKR